MLLGSEIRSEVGPDTKLVFADVDGTMLRYDTDVPTPAVIEAVEALRGQGGILVPVTTRSADLMQVPAQYLGLRDYGVLDGGATLFDFSTGQQVPEHTRWLDPPDIQRVVSAIGELCTEVSYETAYRTHDPATVDIDIITEPAPSVFVVFPKTHETAIAERLEGIGVDGYTNTYEDNHDVLRCMQIVQPGVRLRP